MSKSQDLGKKSQAVAALNVSRHTRIAPSLTTVTDKSIFSYTYSVSVNLLRHTGMFLIISTVPHFTQLLAIPQLAVYKVFKPCSCPKFSN